MIAEPISLNNAAAAAQSFKKTAQTGRRSDWYNSTTNTTTDSSKLAVSHQSFGKGGVSRRSLIQINRKAISVSLLAEIATLNLTLTMPEVRTVLTDTQINDMKAELSTFINNSTLWDAFRNGES